jgi:hypothetical protein
MSSTKALRIIEQKNRSKKVKQLNEIALLFEAKSKIDQEEGDLRKLLSAVEEQESIAEELRASLPKDFLLEQSKLRREIINSIRGKEFELEKQKSLLENECISAGNKLHSIQATLRNTEEKIIKQYSAELAVRESVEHADSVEARQGVNHG